MERRAEATSRHSTRSTLSKNDEATALNETAPESGKSNIVQDAEESPKKKDRMRLNRFFQAMKYETGKGMEKILKGRRVIRASRRERSRSSTV